ncbi:MAG TPA: regulator [Terrimesophilobacter sp.]|nr:regulator [Terrimesophilobacter sp.]
MRLRLALALPPDQGGRVLRDVKANGHDAVFHAASGDDLARAISRLSVDVAVTSARAGYLSEGLLAACDDAGVRLVCFTDSPSERAFAAGLGLVDAVDASASWEEVHAALTATPWTGLGDDVEESDGRMPSAAGHGTVIAVWGPAGAPGRTTLAINVAAELAAEGKSVVLADADTHGGAIAPALGLLDEAPGFAAACRLAGTGGLNHTELERVGQRYRSAHGSFWVLTGISRPSRWPELAVERAQATIEQCRSFAEFTVIDTGFSLENDEEISSDLFAPRRNAATVTALLAADQVFAVGSADPVGLPRLLRGHVDLLDTVDAERVHVVMNRVRSSVVGPNPGSQVRRALERFGGIVTSSIVPHDPSGLDAALLAGKTLRDTAAKSPARSAIAALVSERILPPVAAPHRARRLPFARGRQPQSSS